MNRDENRLKNRKLLRARQKMNGIEGIDLYKSTIGLATRLPQLIEVELRNHPSLVGIYRLPDLPGTCSEELLQRVGLTGYKIHYWPTDGELSGISDESDGGYMVTIYGAAKEYRTAVFLRRRDRPEESHSDEINDVLNTAVLYHELGHIDDFERRVNLRPGEKLDVRRAELYAHHFTCRSLRRLQLPVPLAAYLHGIAKHMTAKNDGQRESSREFWLSPECKTYRKIAEHARDWFAYPDDVPQIIIPDLSATDTSHP